MDREAVGKRVRRSREKLSMSREDFAEKVDISPQFLAEIENNTKGMSAETLCKMCENAGISADYILLGRQYANGLQLPAVEVLRLIPPEYSDKVEELLRVFLDTINIAEDKNT